MPELHVFSYEGEEWYVAASLDDFWVVFEEQTGMTRADQEDDSEVTQLPDDLRKTICTNADGEIASDDDWDGNETTLTCGEWAKREGRGMLCTRNL